MLDTAKERFHSFRGDVLAYVDTLTVSLPARPLSARFRELVDYTTRGGKCVRGLLAALAFLEATGTDPRAAAAAPAYALGWAQELLQASFLVADDLMDRSPLRRGRPSWYARDGNGYVAVSDSYFLENAAHSVIDHFCGAADRATLRDVKAILHETTLATAIGQFLDGAKLEPRMENWCTTVTCKTAHYTILQPLRAGMRLAGRTCDGAELRELLLRAGRLFQCEDDYLDLYGDYAKLGKVGTDIQDGKLTWLYARAVEAASAEQRAVLEACIGSSDADKVDAVKRVYAELRVGELCLEFQRAEYAAIEEGFARIGGELPGALAEFVLSLVKTREF